MALAVDTSSESAVSTSAASFSWNHPGNATTARSALVFVISIQGTSDVTSVTYGGATMAFVGRGSDTDTEPATIDCYFLDDIADGNQTVLVNRVNDATQMMGMCVTLNDTVATEVYTAGMITTGGSSQNTGISTSGTSTAANAQVSVDDGSPGTNSYRFAACYTGAASPPSAGAQSTLLQNHDFTAFGWTMVQETNSGQGSRLIGCTSAADDRAGVHIAVRETPPPATNAPFPFFGGNYYPTEG